MSAKTRWFLALLLIGASACASQTSGTPSTGTSSTKASPSDPVGALAAQIQSLRDRGATDDDVRALDQRLRLAQASQKSGDSARAHERATEGLELAEVVDAGLDTKIRDTLDRMDVEIRRDIRDINQDLRDKIEDRAIDRYEDLKKKIADRNARAASTHGRFPVNTFSKELEPIEARISAIREGQAARNVTWNETYRAQFGNSLMRVRGTESIAYQEGVRAHRAGDARLAKQGYLAVLTDEPNNYKALFNLGVLDLETGSYQEAATRLEKAFDLGLGIDQLDGWLRDFVPDPEPLIAAYHETNQTAKIADVRARYTHRKAQVDAKATARQAEEDAALKAASTNPAAPAEQAPAAPTASAEDACLARPYAGKVAFVKVGLDPKGVEEIICAPQNKRMKGDAEYWYYPSGTVIFINGKVDRTANEQVLPGG